MFPGAIIQFSFVELEQATEKFSRSNLIGIGESSNVHRGQANDGIIVAIKKLNLPGGFEEDYGFLDEFLDMFWDVRAIKKAHHRHAKLFLHQKSALVSKKREADDSLASDKAKVSRTYTGESSPGQSVMGAYRNAQNQWPAGYGQNVQTWPQTSGQQWESKLCTAGCL